MHALHAVLGKEKLESRPKYWYCHCCLKQNKVVYKNETKNMCVTCGRPSTYTQDGYALPLHGKGVQVYRPAQIVNVLENLDESDMFDWTGLHSAAVKGNAPVVKELLELGCIVDARTKHHQTALHLAVYAGSLPSVKLLIEAGANLSRVTHLEQVTHHLSILTIARYHNQYNLPILTSLLAITILSILSLSRHNILSRPLIIHRLMIYPRITHTEYTTAHGGGGQLERHSVLFDPQWRRCPSEERITSYPSSSRCRQWTFGTRCDVVESRS